MPVNYSIDPDPPRLVRTVFYGDLRDEDLAEHLDALTNDSAFDPSFPELIDMTEVRHTSVTGKAIANSAHSGLHSPTAKRAFVAPTDVLYGLSRMYQLSVGIAEGDYVAVFRTLPLALAWLEAES